jgi:hypothetical protein
MLEGVSPDCCCVCCWVSAIKHWFTVVCVIARNVVRSCSLCRWLVLTWSMTSVRLLALPF